MSSPSLLDLPPELALEFMSRLETPRDLFTLIRTSRHFWQDFQGSRIPILVSVIQNSFPDGNIDIAIAACDSGQISKMWHENPSVAAVVKSHDEFLKNYPWGRASQDRSLRDMSLLRSLYKLWWTVDYFMSRFERDALSFAAQNLPLWDDRRMEEATKSERGRLQRAFLRLEIFRRIQPATLQSSAHLVPDQYHMPNRERDGVRNFLRWFQPWEREEILSAQEFLFGFAKNLLSELENHIVCETGRWAREMAVKTWPLQGSFEVEPLGDLEWEFDTHLLNIFAHGERRLSYLVARGLPFLRWLSNLTTRRQISVINHHYSSRCSTSVLETLHHNFDVFMRIDARQNWQTATRAGISSAPNEGWLWAQRNDLVIGQKYLDQIYELRRSRDNQLLYTYALEQTGPNHLLCRRTLRQMGFVFWDSARLLDDWRLPSTSPSMLELPLRYYKDDDNVWIKNSRFEERFKEIAIPKGSFHSTNEDQVWKRFVPDDKWSELTNEGHPVPFSKAEDDMFGIEY